MCKAYPYLLIAFFVMVNFSCKKNDKLTIVSNRSWPEIVETANAQQKGIILIMAIRGCSQCETFEGDLIKDPDFASKVAQQFIVARVDYNAAGGEWLARVLKFTGFPSFFTFDEKNNLVSTQSGYYKEDIIDILSNKSIKRHPFKNYDLSNKTYDDIVKIYNDMFKAELGWQQFSVTKNKDYLNKLEAILLKNRIAYSYFYNNYLLSKYYAINKDSVSAKTYAINALGDTSLTSQFVYGSLRTEMKYQLDNKYKPDSEAYLAFEETEKNLGELHLGDEKTIGVEFKNSGKVPLIIKKVSTTCGCTVPFFSKEPIRSGKSGLITVSFSANEIGFFSKTMYVFANASNSPKLIRIKGIVKE